MNKSPAGIFHLFLTVVFLFFFYKLFEMQILRHGEYGRFAEENAARVNRLLAPRGIIYDRMGKIMVKNQPVFSARFYPDRIKEGNPEEIVQNISAKIGVPFEELREKVKNSTNPSYEGIELLANLSMPEVVKIEEAKLQGVVLQVYPLREYPYKKTGIHLLGEIGEISQAELGDAESADYKMGDFIGKDGIEKYYDRYLRGVVGGEKMEVDVQGKPVRLKEALEPKPGNNLKLTIDQEMQGAVEEALGSLIGAVVVLDPRSGEILSMVSHPAYDPNEDWENINQRDHPFMNRAISAYPAGSIFKPAVLQGALEENVIRKDETIVCHGYINLGSRVARCWRSFGHGSITFIEGLVWSCDVAFYELGRRLGVDRLNKYGLEFGLGEKTGVDLPGEKKGLIPSAVWKEKVYHEKWFDGDTINFGIGQGYLLVTPLQIAGMYAEVATGKRYKPFLVKEIRSADGTLIFEQAPVLVSEHNIFPEIKNALREVVRRGTGVAAKVDGLPAAGKTGTAENPGLAHAWFTAYAPYDNPEIVIAAFIEHGEHGDRAPAIVTKKILEWHKQNRFKREIPPEEPTSQYILRGEKKDWYYPTRLIPQIATPEVQGGEE